jgi:site-specific DNA-methyltransferase (adenine-specific)
MSRARPNNMEPSPADFALEQEPVPASRTDKGVGSGPWLGGLEATCEDCMALMARYPDKHFDLAIVDPPYGIGEDGAKNHSRDRLARATRYAPKSWDKSPPPMEYFAELRRVSRNQIIWGGNYFPLPPTSCWVVWDKDNSGDFADCELAWTSFKTAVRKFKFRWNGMLQGNMAEKEVRIHPTQKPVALYRWLLAHYAKPGQRILDTHLGSGSHAIAAHYAGVHLTACEIDPDYFAAAMERIQRETAQTTLFT